MNLNKISETTSTITLGWTPPADAIQSGRYGYIPPYDILGNPRTTADAGCYAH